MKRIGCGPCACACHSSVAADSNNLAAAAADTSTPQTPNQRGELPACTRPTMATLHKMLHNQEWKGIQEAIRNDASVAMRIDDSVEEDVWFDMARRRKAVQEGVDVSLFDNRDAVARGANDVDSKDMQERDSYSDRKDNTPQMQLRYWVGNQTDNNTDAYIRATVDIQQKRTLLHSLVRMYLPSNEALVVQLQHGDSEGLRKVMGAVKTAGMLINASHNNSLILDDDDDEMSDDKPVGAAWGGKTPPHCNDCPCHFYQHYCPPMPLPPVERREPESPDIEDLAEPSHSDDEGKGNEMIEHTSVLTMTDAMGDTPLHALTGAGSCHVDLVKVFIKACRSFGDSERRPTVYDLLVAQNFHGCSPLHFIADSQNEECLRLLLEHCQFHNASSSDGRTHPTMVCDNEGDLALHFAACSGATPSMLHILTNQLGNGRSAIVRNSLCRLAIDDLIDCYLDKLDEQMNDEAQVGDVGSQNESEGDSDSSESSSVSSNSSSGKKDSTISPFNCKRKQADEGDPEYYASNIFGFLSSETNWESELWAPMWVLIQAAVAAIRNSAHNGQQTTVETQMQSDQNAYLQPIHAAVMATKAANFPALALTASMFLSPVHEDINHKEYNRTSQRLSPLLEEDLYGYLPLHWACTNVVANKNEINHGSLNPSTSQCNTIVRWNTKNLPCSMIEYLLHCEPAAARIPTRDRRLPLHLLVEDCRSSASGQKLYNKKESEDNQCCRDQWDDIKLLLVEYPESLATPDPTTKLYPFQIAAASSTPSPHNRAQSCTDPQSGLLSLDYTYRLIMEDPSLLCQIIDK